MKMATTAMLTDEQLMESDYSSPPHNQVFSSSPRRDIRKIMSLTRNNDSLSNEDITSRPTSISSDNDEEGEDDSKGMNSTSKQYQINSSLDKDGGSEKLDLSDSEKEEEEDGMAFLNRFRQRQAATSDRIDEAIDSQYPNSSSNQTDFISGANKLQVHHSSIFSGSLSELSSTQQNADVISSDYDANQASSSTLNLQHLRRLDPDSPFMSSNDSRFNIASQEGTTYITEAEKRAKQDHKRAERRIAMERLAAKSRNRNDNDSDRESSVPTEDHITSNSEQDTINDRIDKKQSKKGKRVKDKVVIARTLNLEPELEAGIGLSSDDEGVRLPHVRPLSKKDLDEMNRVQARIEREKRISSARVRQAPRERKRFDIHDLLAKIGSSEADRKQTLPLTKLDSMNSPRQSCQSPSSDPIEAFSETDDINESNNLAPKKLSSRPLYAQMKGRLVDDDDDDDINLFDSENLIEKALRQSEERDRWRKWQERKKAVLKEAITNTNDIENGEDDDIELYQDDNLESTSTNTSQRKNLDHIRTSAKQYAEPQRMLNGLDSKLIDDDEPEMSVSTQQIQHFGRLIGQPKQQESTKDAIVDARNAGQSSNMPKSTGKKKDQIKGTKTVDLKAYIMQKMERQNIESRKGKGLRARIVENHDELEKQDIATLIDDLRRNVQNTHENHQDGEMSDNDDDDDDDDSDYAAEDGEQEQDIELDFGSGNESEGTKSVIEDSSTINVQTSADNEELQVSENEQEEDQEDNSIKPRITQKSKKHQHNRIVLDEEDGLDLFGSKENVSTTSECAPGKEEEVRDAKEGDNETFTKQMPSTLINADHVKKDINPNPSAVFGQFFEDTQSDVPLQNDSFKVLSINGQDGAGFTQFFEQGTPIIGSSTKNGLMPPPTTSAKGFHLFQSSEQDEFAALRKAQASQAKLIDDEPFDLPELDDILLPEQQDENLALELEAMRAEEEERLLRLKTINRSENGMTYINKEGFFTQTRPQSYSFQLSQMHSQAEASVQNHPETKQSFANSEIEIDNDKDDEEDDDDDDDAILNSKMKRRFRRAAPTYDEDDQEQKDKDDIQTMETRQIEQNRLPTKQTAFDVLRKASNSVTRKEEKDKARKKFIQGEAEESDGESEDENGKNERRHGGLEGVFSDQDDRNSSEDEEDEEDGQDLEDLIDEEQDEKEAEKDILARERYLQDMDEDEKAALALHERAIRGAFRNKRRARNHQNGNLEGFLEDDYEDDWLQKLAKNPYGNIAKKRKLEGKDGMDLLAEKEDSQAFVREYHDSHRDSQPLDAYSFLMNVEEDENDEDLSSDHETNDHDGKDQNAFISRKDIQEAIAEKRKAKRMEAKRLHTLDDEIEMEEKRKKQEEEEMREKELRRNIERALYNASDDEDEDEIQIQKHNYISTRSYHRKVTEKVEEEEALTSSLGSVLPGVATHSFVSDRERARLAKLAKDFENEPDWQSAKEAIQRVRGRTINKNESLENGNVGKGDLNGKQTASTSSTRIRTRLQGVMSRENLFS